MVSSVEIKELAKEISDNHNLNYYEVLQRYMFERILERISVSKYRDNFILKGGLLLSAMFGIDNRMTKDMDTTITGMDVSKDKMSVVLNEILCIKLGDGVKFDVVWVNDIRKEDEYGGNKYHIVGRLENLKVNLEIDISTGDKVTPRELKFKYPLLFEDRSILVNSYNIETILAEKIETVLRRGRFNSRMKDYYDIYYFLTILRKNIDMQVLRSSIINTFSKRGTLDYLNDYERIIDSMIDNKRIENLWLIYSRKYKYVKDIQFNEILALLKNFIGDLELNIVAIC